MSAARLAGRDNPAAIRPLTTDFPMDQFDRKILRHLRESGRSSYVELAQAVNLSETSCQRRVRALEEAGVISGYAALIDERALGLSLSVFVTVTLASQAEAALGAFERAIQEVPEVAECHLMTGGADYLLRLAVRDVDDLERVHSKVLTRIPGVERISSSLAMRTVVRRTVLPD
jgi:DNA-binding Lrp family transcriptional regulator